MRGSLDATAESTALNRQGGWNDQPAGGDGNLGKYPLCETRAPDKKNVAGIHSLNGATNTQQVLYPPACLPACLPACFPADLDSGPLAAHLDHLHVWSRRAVRRCRPTDDVE
jgi:hypothetical protein